MSFIKVWYNSNNTIIKYITIEKISNLYLVFYRKLKVEEIFLYNKKIIKY